MYINYNTVGGIEYGTVTSSVRKGQKVGKGDQIYLGRVIDKDRGIFKSRERGLFTYSLETNSFGKVPADYIEPKQKRKTIYEPRPQLIVSFGDVYLLNEYIMNCGFDKAIDAIGFRNPDTIRALLAYYILSPHANCHAEDWWNLTYARFLYPRAQMSSQRISDALADIGSEDAKRQFFKEYFHFLAKDDNVEIDKNASSFADGILIDSSGLPNAIHFPLTAVSNHNGEISEEVRLIYVVQQQTGMPLFFRYVAGSVIDVSTLPRTIAELRANGINTNFAILDAGYYTGKNADVLLDAGISFISRMKSNFKVYKRVVENHLDKLESKENFVRFNKRLVYVKCIPCSIGEKENRKAYAYLCRDLTIKHELQKHLIERAEDEDLQDDEVFDAMREHGIFVLISSKKIDRKKILQVYYTRDQVEKIFELCKQDAKILPVNVETEATFRGHLMMTFMAAALLKMISGRIAETTLTTESMFMNLHEQHGIVYEKELITTEPNKKMNIAYNTLGIECPTSLPITVQ